MKWRRRTVPINIDFAIHRYGEWIMLMLGESVLSLLVVDMVDSAGYYGSLFGGIMSIILLQYLHFSSAPSDPDQHAIRRSIVSSFAFYWLFEAYSLALIVLGVSYKMSLLELVLMEEEKEDGSHRKRGLLFQGGFSDSEKDDHRWLAATGASTASGLSVEERQQHIAHLFSGSMAVIFFGSDAMSLAHRGIRAQIQRCECANTLLKKITLTILVTSRVSLLVVIASLSQFVTKPSDVITAGTLAILAQVCVRLLGGVVFHSQEESEMKAMERCIRYNQSRIHDRPGYSDSQLSGSALAHPPVGH
jgi:hypothetical protein